MKHKEAGLVTEDFTRLSDLDGPGEARSNVAELARLFPDAVVDGTVDVDVLRDLLGEAASAAGAEGFGLRWPGMSDARRLSTLPATMTLLPKPEESMDWGKTKNIVIEGDNLEVLRLLRRAYTNSVDVIYIDPPYNTGNDFVYDDSRTSSQAEHESEAGLRDEGGVLQVGAGSDRADARQVGASLHSTWLSMMYPRLLVAHHLLSESGVIVVAIDDTEHARLKLLLDRVFGSENFLANLCWQGGVSALAKHTGGGLDYMLIYAKNRTEHINLIGQWRTTKKGVADFIDAGRAAWQKSKGDPAAATQLFRTWLQGAKAKFDTSITVYDRIDESGRLFFAGDLANGMLRPNLQYDIIHPVTGKVVRMPEKGWRHESVRMQSNIDAGLVLFGPDEMTIPTLKRYLEEYVTQVPTPSFYRDRRSATGEVAALVGSGVFDFPKDTGVLADWLATLTGGKLDAFVLDFFSGSGSTGHAVMNLNAADDGSRRYLAVQLDEVVDKHPYTTIADITRERLRRAGAKIAEGRDPEAAPIDTGFRSYRLADSNVKPWDGSGEIDLLAAVDNFAEGRTTDDLLVEMMLRLGVDLVTPVATRDVAGNTLYSLAGTLYAFFGADVGVATADQVAKAIVSWRDEEPVDSEITVVVRDTGFNDSSAKLNLAEALKQAGIKTFRSI